MTITDAQLIQAANHLRQAMELLQLAAIPAPVTPERGAVSEFLNSGLVDLSDPRAKTRCIHIHARYETWCAENDKEPLHIGYFGRALKAAGFKSLCQSNGSNILGIRLPIPAPSEASLLSE